MGYTTLELKVNYIRATQTNGTTLTGEETVPHRGRKVATAEGRVMDQRGKLVTHATIICLIVSP